MLKPKYKCSLEQLELTKLPIVACPLTPSVAQHELAKSWDCSLDVQVAVLKPLEVLELQVAEVLKVDEGVCDDPRYMQRLSALMRVHGEARKIVHAHEGQGRHAGYGGSCGAD